MLDESFSPPRPFPRPSKPRFEGKISTCGQGKAGRHCAGTLRESISKQAALAVLSFKNDIILEQKHFSPFCQAGFCLFCVSRDFHRLKDLPLA
jgi:hypothetical protein